MGLCSPFNFWRERESCIMPNTQITAFLGFEAALPLPWDVHEEPDKCREPGRGATLQTFQEKLLAPLLHHIPDGYNLDAPLGSTLPAGFGVAPLNVRVLFASLFWGPSPYPWKLRSNQSLLWVWSLVGAGALTPRAGSIYGLDNSLLPRRIYSL